MDEARPILVSLRSSTRASVSVPYKLVRLQDEQTYGYVCPNSIWYTYRAAEKIDVLDITFDVVDAGVVPGTLIMAVVLDVLAGGHPIKPDRIVLARR